MSLINDALKRANAAKNREAQSPAPVPPMEPVESTPSSKLLPFSVLLLGVGVLVIGGALWFRGSPSETKQIARTENSPSQAEQIPSVEKAPQASPEVKVAEPKIAAPQPARVASVSAPTNEPTVVASVSPNEQSPSINTNPISGTAPGTVALESKSSEPVKEIKPSEPKVAVLTTQKEKAAAVAPATRDNPSPRLQAIYYRLRNPTIVLNGKTIGVGQSVDGMRVVSIQRTSVEVVQDGKYRTLTLQD